MICIGKTKCTSEKGLLVKPIARDLEEILLKRRRTYLFVIVSKELKCTLTGHDLQI